MNKTQAYTPISFLIGKEEKAEFFIQTSINKDVHFRKTEIGYLSLIFNSIQGAGVNL